MPQDARRAVYTILLLSLDSLPRVFHGRCSWFFTVSTCKKAYLKKSLICPAMICISRFRASTLAHAICGVMISFLLSLIFTSGFVSLIGSLHNTSRPAAAISPASNASHKSYSTTIGPRPRFKKIAVFFIFANAFLSIRFLVYSFNGACTDTISDSESNVSKSTCSYPS